MKKKGLSPVIASVLLIALVLVLAVIVFMWARNFVSERIEKFGAPIEQACGEVAFDVEIFEDEVYGGEGKKIEIANRGSVPIHNFEIKQIDGRGNSDSDFFKIPVYAGKSIREGINLEGDTEEVIVYPTLLGSSGSANKIFTCLDKGKTITV